MYNKIFTKILDSSIWLETDATRLVWLTLIASMDEDGFVQFASIENLAHRTRVSLEAAEKAVKTLESADKNSSDPDNEGRRIERIPGGWIVLNAAKYRELVTRAVAQEKTRLRVARFRENKKVTVVTKGNAPVTGAKRSVTPSDAVSDAVSGSLAEKNTLPVKPAKREPNPCFDALCEFEGIPLAEVGASGGRIATALKAIKQVTPEVTPDEINRRGENYRLHFSGGATTATALSKHWGKCHASPSAKNGAVPWQVKSHETNHEDGFFGKDYKQS